MAARDVKLRFRQTKLGALWLIMNPLIFTVGYAFLFGSIGHVPIGNHNYFVYTYCGMSLWTSFSAVFARTGNCLLGNRELLTHAYFPRLTVPLATTLATQVDVVISWGILVPFLVLTGEPVGVGLLLIPVWFGVAQLLALACGLIAASWSIEMRDLQAVTAVAIAAGPIFTPVAYPPSALPQHFQWLATINPLTPLFNGMRASAFGDAWPAATGVGFSLAALAVLTLLALAIFARAERRLADVI